MMKKDIPELDNTTINGIIGTVAAFAVEQLEGVTHMSLTFDEYAIISPALRDVESLIFNKAIGAYTRYLCILMYRLGQENAQTPERRPPTDEEQNAETQTGDGSR